MKKTLLLLSLIAIVGLGITGCSLDTPSPVGTAAQEQQQEQQAVKDNQQKLAVAVPLPQLNNSLERINIKKRLETFDNPNKVSYIYLVNFGKVMAFYTIKGKITSGNKRLTSDQTLNPCDGGEYNQDCIMSAPELDGTYGTSAPYIFFWTTEGVYVQWSGDYMLVDQPLKLTTQPGMELILLN